MYRRGVVTQPKEISPELFALTHLSVGIQTLRFKDDWITCSLSENSAAILGVPVENLLATSSLWIRRIHPSDVDAVRGALQSTTEKNEKHISFRFRDSNEQYRWIGIKCKRKDTNTIIGVFSDITRHRVQEYSDRIHLAGRNALKALLDSGDLNNSINTFLQLLGNAMLIDRARLVRFRKDGRAFITHEIVRNDAEEKLELPMQVPPDAVNWWKNQLETLGVVAISTTNDDSIPEPIKEIIQACSVGAVMAVPALVNGVIEGFACFETFGERLWLPLEMEEAKHMIDGYSRLVERRIEDRKQIAKEFNLRRSEERYRLLTTHSPVILFGIDSDGVFMLSEGLGLESMGAGPGEVVGKSVYQIYRNYPDILEQVNTALSGVESHGFATIGERYFEFWFTPVHDEDKLVVGLSGVSVDITRRHKLERQQSIMMSELDHRVKNNIAAVMSLVGLSKEGAGTIDEFANTLDGRLHALAVAHSTLAKSHWSGAWMRDILLLTLQPYMVGEVEKISFKGPDVELLGILARPMCMVIHELATNAVKYGALSSSNGTITITTEMPSSKDSVALSWVEIGGPEIVSNVTPSTGTSLLEGLVKHEMNGTISLDYSKKGLVCKINVPLTKKT